MSSIFQNPPPINLLFQDGFANCLARLGNNVTLSGVVSLTTMHSFTLPKGTLLQPGQTMYVVSRTTRNNSNATITLTFQTAGVGRGSYTLPIAGTPVVQYLVGICQRLGAGTLNVSTILFRDIPASLSGGAIVMQGADSAQGSNLDTSDVLIEIAAAVNNAGDSITSTLLTAFVI